MIRIFPLFLAVISSIACYGGDVTTLSGIVSDKGGAGLPYATVRAVSLGEARTVQTDVTGLYSLTVPCSDSIVVSVSYEGFKSQKAVFRGKQVEIRRDFVLEEDAVALQEVVVQGSRVIHGNSKSMYFPVQKQRKGTNTGLGLLANMMIPELRISKTSGTVTTSDRKNVTLCINGVSASREEINAVRPNDVIRIDYHPVPTGKFAGYEAVVDYIVRSYRHGGYLELRSSTTLLNTAGEYGAVLKYNCNTWTHSLIAGTDFTDYRKNENEVEEKVGLPVSFKRKSVTDDYRLSSTKPYFYWGMNRITDRVQISLKVGGVMEHIPHSDNVSSSAYLPAVYSPSLSVVRENARNASIYLNGYTYYTLDKKNYLMLAGSYQYGHNDFDRTMTEGAYGSAVSTMENSHDFSVGLTYIHNTEKNGGFTFRLYDLGNVYKDRYGGDVDSRQRLVNNYIQADLQYRYSFSERLFAQTELTLRHVSSKVSDAEENTWLFLPTLYVSCKTGEKGHLVVNAKTGYVAPPIQWKSDLYQNVNAYEQVKGNKELEHVVAYMPSVSYSYSFSRLMMNASVNAFLSRHSIHDVYYQENNRLIHSYALGKSLCQFMFDYKVTSFLLDNSLQVSGGISYYTMKTNDDFRNPLRGFVCSFDAMYSCGSFTFSGSYVSKYKSMDFTSSAYSDLPCVYSLSASYAKGGWFASVSLANFFNRKTYGKEYINSEIYQRTDRFISPDISPSVIVKLSYCFDFGRKKLDRNVDEPQKTISTGYLRPKD